jgi:hypothetical protein
MVRQLHPQLNILLLLVAGAVGQVVVVAEQVVLEQIPNYLFLLDLLLLLRLEQVVLEVVCLHTFLG